MDKRTFLLSCSAFAVALALPGTACALKAAAANAAGQSDAERILRITRRASAKFRLLEVPYVHNILQYKPSRYTLISLQSTDEYITGHIPGFMLLPESELSNPEKLNAFINKLPQDKPIIVTCPNGHLSCALALFLCQLGFNASAIALGMYGWNRKYAGEKVYKGDINGEICLEAKQLPLGINQAVWKSSGLPDTQMLIQNSQYRFLNTVDPNELSKDLSASTMFCLRRPEDYSNGHIPGSINIPNEAFYYGDKIILQIPRNKKITLSCYVGNYSSGASLVLTQLGYETQTLAWGMGGWNNKHIGLIVQNLLKPSILPIESGNGIFFMDS